MPYVQQNGLIYHNRVPYKTEKSILYIVCDRIIFKFDGTMIVFVVLQAHTVLVFLGSIRIAFARRFNSATFYPHKPFGAAFLEA